MKKAYNLIFVLNIILGLYIFANDFLIIDFSPSSIFIILFVSLLYIYIAFKYGEKKYKKFETIDKVFINIMLVFCLFVFGISLYYQVTNTEIFMIQYFNNYLRIIHAVLLFYYISR